MRGIVSFIGIDYALLKQSGEDNIAKFILSGIFVGAIVLISFLSVYYAFELMFHKWYAELLLSTFFSLTFLTIYLLLIQTFSKETLPAAYKVTFFNTSNITRICFVLLISFLIAQPAKIFMLREPLENDIENYKVQLYNEFAANAYKLYQSDLTKLNQKKDQYSKMTYDNYTASLIHQNNQQIKVIVDHINADNAAAYHKIAGSDFFLKRIEFARKYPLATFTCWLVILIFSVPVFLIYSISDNSKYYTAKREADHRLVDNAYADFKVRYARIFKEKYKLEVEFHEAFLDPPYNRLRMPDPDRGDNTDFVNDYGLR